MLKHFGRKLKRSVYGHRPSSVRGESSKGRSTHSSKSGASISSEADSWRGAELDEKDSRLCRSWEELPSLLHRELSDSQRLENLWTLGNCKDVKVADTIHIHTHGDDCNLSLVEWEALLVPLKSNPSLEEIHIRLPPGQPPETWEIIGRYWEGVVKNASALKKLSVSIYRSHSCEGIPFSVDTDFETDASSISVLLPSVLKHLASGLRANPDPALEKLYVEFGDSASSDMVDHVVEMLACTLKKLRKLSLVHVPRLEGSKVKALSNALEQCTSLCTLEIEGAEEGMTEVLLQSYMYRGSGSVQILLKKLILRGPCIAGLGPALPQLLAAKIKHLVMDFSDLVWWLGEDTGLRDDVNFPWREMGSALLRAECLQEFAILLECKGRVLGPRRTQIETCIEGLKEVWEASKQSQLFCISLNWDILDFHKYQNYADVLSYVDVLRKALSLDGLKNVRVILDVTNSDDVEALVGATESVIDTLNKNTDIETCSLGFTQGAGRRSEMSIPQIRSLLVDNLRQNSSIKHLTLEASFFQCLTEEVFREVMRLFTENFTVQQVDVNCDEWEHDGKAALVQKAIDRNARNAEEISVIRGAGLKFGRGKAGRVLLCGAPGAGKSRLKKSMVYAAKTDGLRTWISLDLKKGRVSSSIRSKLEFRTEGTGISTLRDDDDMHLSLWDIGDRKIFRALEKVLFPETGPPCLFLFVFNPTEVSPRLSRKKENLESSFQKELKSWIRFIASNCAVTGAPPPQMMVVLSHKDKMGRSDKDLKWAKDIVSQLRIAFKGVVDLCELEGQDPDIQLVNCFDSGDVRPLNESIFHHMRSVFDKLMAKHLVPQPAIDLTSVFAKKPDGRWNKPIWRTECLYECFCDQNEALRKLDTTSSGSRQTILQVVARYLHDAGIIVIIDDSDLVVVDPSWMAKFLGWLISEGTCFQSTGRASWWSTKSSDSYNGQWHGFVAKNTVHEMLSTLIERYEKEEGIQLDPLELRDLLFRLHLCFDSGSNDSGDLRYFMPAIVGAPEGAGKPAWSLTQWPCSSGDGARDFGYRLQCKERERTCLPMSFFPMFQIKLRKRLVQTLKMNEENVICSRGLMEIREDGHEIFVECDELGEDHLDIMVRSSSHDRKDKARKFIHMHIINPLLGTSASEMGCSGISWSLYILRTDCVTTLTQSEYRGDEQTISAEELKRKLKDNAVQQMGYTKQQNISTDMWIDSCLQYQQSWPEIKDAAGKPVLWKGSELARELLSARDQREITADLRNLARALTHKPSYASRRTHEREVIKLNDEVYEIHSPLQDDPRVEMVFFHGIVEHESDDRPYLTTWSTRPTGPKQVAGPKRDSRECWLNTWLVSDEDLKLARVLTVASDTSTRKTGSRGNFDSYQLAENVTHSLIVQAEVGQHNCPVVLVGHCVGGLVIKKVCIQAFRNLGVENSHRDLYENFLKAVKGMFFYSTPHLGFSPDSKLLDRQLSVPPSPSVRSTIDKKKGDLMESVELWNKSTSRDNDDFEKIRRKFQWKTSGVGESNETKFPIDKNISISQFLVHEASARAESTDEFAVVPNTDHFTICKPEDTTSDNFLRLKRFVTDRVLEVYQDQKCRDV